MRRAVHGVVAAWVGGVVVAIKAVGARRGNVVWILRVCAEEGNKLAVTTYQERRKETTRKKKEKM